MTRKFIALISYLIWLSLTFSTVWAFDDQDTHPRITEKSVSNSNLDKYLNKNLGFTSGSLSIVNGKPIIKVLREGSTDEDSPLCRPSNHFHNPLKPWDQSYMTDQPWWLDLYCSSWNPRYSNVAWGTGYISPAPDGSKITIGTQQMGWDNAREYYHLALTSQSSADRETNFAITFQSLGQVIHLIEDIEVLDYVRRGA